MERYGLSGRRGVALAALALAAAVSLGWTLLGTAGGKSFSVSRDASGSSSEDAASSANPVSAQGSASEAVSGTGSTPAEVVVHVDGAVASPGVYTLTQENPRVDDAVRAAGGLTDEADTVSLNLAAVVTDGEKVHVPAVGETQQGTVATGVTSGSTGTTSADGGLVNINTADAAALDVLPGIGEATAEAIIQDREENGPFASTEDLMRVSGIGEKKFEKLKGMICV